MYVLVVIPMISSHPGGRKDVMSKAKKSSHPLVETSRVSDGVSIQTKKKRTSASIDS